jgi:TolA-binding protein
MPTPVLLFLALALPLLDDADERYQFAAGLFDKKLYEMAAKENAAFLKQFPDHPKAPLARYRLGCSLFELKRAAEAEPHFRALAGQEGFEYRAEVALRLGQCALQAGRFDEASSMLEVARARDYLKAPATFLLGETEFRRQRFPEAAARYREALEADPKGELARECEYGLAWCAYRTGQHDEAVQRIQRFLRERAGDPFVAELRFLLGEAHLEAGRAEPALQAYRSVPEGPFHDGALRGAGFARAALGDARGAADEFGRLLELHPKSRFAAEASLHRGIQLLKAGDAPAAREALAAAGDGPEALYWSAQAESRGGDREGALKTLDRALRAKPPAELAERLQVARGDVLFELGRGEEAARSYERSGSDYALQAAAVASLKEGRTADAARLARQLLQAHPSSRYVPEAHLVIGEALFAEKKYAEAEEAFGAAGDTARAVSRTGWCRFLANDFPGAAGRFAEVGKRFPDAPEAAEAAFLEGRARLSANDPEGAARAWKRYLEKHPKDERRAEALLALARLERGEVGRARLELLLRDHGDGPHAARALYELAESLYQEGKREPAEARFRELLERSGKSELAPAARYGLAWCLFDRKAFAEAGDLLRLVTRPDSGATDDLRLSALELSIWAEHKAGRADAAVEAFRAFAKLCPDEARRLKAAKTAALALKETGRLDPARALYEELLRTVRDPQVGAQVRVETAYLALDQKKTDEAEVLVREAAKAAPEAPEVAQAFFFVGEARFESGDDGKAVPLYQLAARKGPVADRALYKEGFARLRMKDTKGATLSFASFVERHPKSDLFGETLFLLGEALFREGRFDEAVPPLERLRKEFPSHDAMPKALFRLGLALARLDRWSDAEAVLADLARRFPKFENLTESELWRGRALAVEGQARGAREAFERVVARDRGVLAARARLELGRLLRAAGDTEQALSEFLKVAVLYAHEEEVAEGLLGAGECMEQLGDSARARGQYQEIVTRYPKTGAAAAAKKRLSSSQ